jgi:hypothetical protein
MVEAGAKDTEPPGAALVALTSICHAPRATPPAKHVSIGPGGAPKWRWRAGRVPIAATGLIATISAGLVIAARSGTSVARADLVDRRPHTDTVTVAMPQPAAEGRERVDVAAPAEAVDASTAPAAKRAVAAERAVTPALRPRSVVAPRREEPSSQPLPSKEETEVDFGI